MKFIIIFKIYCILQNESTSFYILNNFISFSFSHANFIICFQKSRNHLKSNNYLLLFSQIKSQFFIKYFYIVRLTYDNIDIVPSLVLYFELTIVLPLWHSLFLTSYTEFASAKIPRINQN